MGGLRGAASAIAVIVAIVLSVAGAFIIVRRPPGERSKGILMIAVAIVTVANVWLLTSPV